MDLERLPVDLVEILNKVTPNEDEVKKFGQFQKDKKDPKTLPDNDRFVFEVREAILSLFALSLAPEVMWSIMASFMLYVVDKYAWDFYMENANF